MPKPLKSIAKAKATNDLFATSEPKGRAALKVASRATSAEQQVRWTSVGSLHTEEKLPAPALFIVGRVASHHLAEISESFWTTRERESQRQIECII